MDLNLHNYSTFKLGGTAYRILNIRNENDIISALLYAQKCQKQLIVIGEGSNSIFSDEDEKFIIAHMQLKGIHIKEDTDAYSIIRIAAGESWDELVKWSVDNNLSGLEALSGIPGTVGAAPIQNIGAYGRELSDVLESVVAYVIPDQRFKVLSAYNCEFGYRNSIFKKYPNKYIISEITIKLFKNKPKIPDYDSIKSLFTSKDITSQQLRDIILEVRKQKLPDYKTIPNCGSFFKNPVITQEEFAQIQNSYPTIPFFSQSDTKIKLYAGWLIENSDYTKAESEHISFYEKQKLVLVNKGGATFAELKNVISNITKQIQDKFSITLEVEPNIFE
jgi:UDP-N-acetylmuramate dehydrogenase